MRIRSGLVMLGSVVLAGSALAQENPPANESTPKTSGYDPDSGFVLRSPDDLYQLRIGLQSGYKFEPRLLGDDWQDRQTFFVLRPYLSGTIYKPWLTFYTSFEFASNPPFLLDSYVEIKPWDWFGVRIGQQWTPLSRHEYYGPGQILFPEWNVVAEYFWTGRDKGVTFFGNDPGKHIEWWAGLYEGSPLRTFTAFEGNYLLEARATFYPGVYVGKTEYPYIGTKGPIPWGVSFTLDGWYGQYDVTDANINPSTFKIDVNPTDVTNKEGGVSGDVMVQGGHFVFLSEIYWRHTNPGSPDPDFDSWGIWGQAGYEIIDEVLDVGVRLSYLDPSTDLSDDRLIAVEAQAAWYAIGTKLVVKLRWALGNQHSPDPATLGAVVLPLPAGTTQLFTLQLNLMI
jgi:hypothetical protein